MRSLLLPLTCAAAAGVMLGGCSAFENLGGGKKVSPDEFKIVSHSPLTMPPNAELRPPRPGEPRPQEVTPADQAKEALSPALAARPQRNQVMTGTAQGPGRTSAETALVQKAGGGNADPNIRSRVNTDTKTINDNDKTFIDNYRTPHTDQLHVTERWRLIEAGKKLEILLTIDDPGTFYQPWQALRQYDRVNRALREDVCSENNINPFGIDYGTPVAKKPDF